MFDTQENFIQQIASKAFEETIKEAIKNFFNTHWDYHSSDDVKQALREAAFEMVRTDPEIQERMKAKLMETIGELKSPKASHR